MKRITLATFKSFVKKNEGRLLIKVKSEFDGMIDGRRWNYAVTFEPAQKSDLHSSHTCGIAGVWLVLGSRDYFSAYSDDKLEGIDVSNCCGTFTVVVSR